MRVCDHPRARNSSVQASKTLGYKLAFLTQNGVSLYEAFGMILILCEQKVSLIDTQNENLHN
jgi:hypothetical protein